MGLYKLYFTLVAFILPAFTFSVLVPRVPPDDFNSARSLINQMKPNIDYSTFCSERPTTGHDKVPCRIKDVPTVGFMVCRTPVLGEGDDVEPCRAAIVTEVTNIGRVRNEGGVKTVEVVPEPIDNVPCADDQTQKTCSGFLEEWVDAKDGQFVQVRNSIVEGPLAIGQLIAAVKTITKAGLLITAADLEVIRNYMMLKPDKNEYRQICDLQGFFLVNGGFLLADIPYIRDGKNEGREGIGKNERCWDEPDKEGKLEPTTEQVLISLNEMITKFRLPGVKP